MMNSSSNRLTLWLAAAVLFLAMIGVGWKLAGTTSSPSASDTALPPNTIASARARDRQRTSLAQKQVNNIQQGASAEARLRNTLALAKSIPPSQFPDWFNNGLFNYRDGFELTLFRKILEERWRDEDPEGFVAWCLEEGLSGPGWAVSSPKEAALPFLKEWAVTDPERLKTFFQQHPNPNLEAQLLADLAKSNPTVAMGRLMSMLNKGADTSSYHLHQALSEIAKSSPETLETALNKLPTDIRIRAERALLTERLSNSFDTELQSLTTRPDGWKVFYDSMREVDGISDKLLNSLAELPDSWKTSLAKGSTSALFNNGGAEKWFQADLEGAGFSPEDAKALRISALSNLTYQKPESALELLNELGLEGPQHNQILRNIFQALRRNPDKGRELAGQLDTAEQQEAALAIIDPPATPTNTIRPTNAENWIELAVAEDPATVDRPSLQYAIRNMKPQEVTALGEKFGTLSGDQKDSVARILSDNSVGNQNPELSAAAVRHVIENPDPEDTRQERNNIRLAASTAANWARTDPNAASTWAQSLPDGEPKLWAQKNVASNWAAYDPDAAAQWVRTLPAETRTAVREFMKEGR